MPIFINSVFRSYLITESPFPHKYTKLVSGSYKGNMTPFDVSNSTITMGSSSASGVRKLYCLSDIFENPVVNTKPCLRNMALVALDPKNHSFVKEIR